MHDSNRFRTRRSNFLQQVVNDNKSPDTSPNNELSARSKIVPISPSKLMLEASNKKLSNLPNLDRTAFMNNVPMYLGKNVIKQNAAETKLSPRLSPKTSNLPTRQNNFNKQSIHSDVCINQQRAKLSVSPNELDSKQSRDVIYEIYGIGSSN